MPFIYLRTNGQLKNTRKILIIWYLTILVISSVGCFFGKIVEWQKESEESEQEGDTFGFVIG